MAELKPCPFCGEKAELLGFTRLWVQCTQCAAQTRLYVYMDAAEEAWNRRVGDDLMERMQDDGK